MFDHLDDPTPFEPSDSFRVAVGERKRRLRRRRRLTVMGAVSAVVLLAGGSAAAYVRSQVGELQRIDVAGLATTTVPGPTASSPAPATNILIAGIDRRPPGEGVVGERADTVAIVRIDPATDQVTLLSLPRDLWVPMVGTGGDAKLNTAIAEGPSQLVQTITQDFGIPIDHYVQVDFDGFRQLIDLAGGVQVRFDQPTRDTSLGFYFDTGCTRLDGSQALAYVRSRHLQTFDGMWRDDPTGDLGRIARQQDLIDRLYERILTTNPSAVDEWHILTDVLDHVTVDSGLDLSTLRMLVDAAQRFGPDGLRTVVLPVGEAATIDNQSVLVATDAAIRGAADIMTGKAAPPLPVPQAWADAVVPTGSCPP
jgi:LCP family protein required for cell wall assembly